MRSGRLLKFSSCGCSCTRFTVLSTQRAGARIMVGLFACFLALVVLALTGPGKYNVIGALGVLFIPSFARLVRGEFLKYRERDFVQAAKLMGVPDPRIIFVHILPNLWPTLLSGLTIGFNNAVLAEASMSYLGIGVNAAEPAWAIC